jgi:hypothetical protein
MTWAGEPADAGKLHEWNQEADQKEGESLHSGSGTCFAYAVGATSDKW